LPQDGRAGRDRQAGQEPIAVFPMPLKEQHPGLLPSHQAITTFYNGFLFNNYLQNVN
jgi:hypothetical protein